MRALRNKETRELVDEIKERYDLDISKKAV